MDVFSIELVRPGDRSWQPFVDWAEANEEAVIALLPPGLHALASVAGLARVLWLVGRFGGREIYLGRGPAAGRGATAEIVAELGADFRRDLELAIGLGRFVVPTARRILCAYRDAFIRRRRAEGASRREIAEQCRVHERTVQRIVNGRATAAPGGTVA